MLSWPSQPGILFRILYTDDLTETDWFIYTDNVVADSGHATTRPITLTSETLFFRIELLEP